MGITCLSSTSSELSATNFLSIMNFLRRASRRSSNLNSVCNPNQPRSISCIIFAQALIRKESVKKNNTYLFFSASARSGLMCPDAIPCRRQACTGSIFSIFSMQQPSGSVISSCTMLPECDPKCAMSQYISPLSQLQYVRFHSCHFDSNISCNSFTIGQQNVLRFILS